MDYTFWSFLYAVFIGDCFKKNDAFDGENQYATGYRKWEGVRYMFVLLVRYKCKQGCRDRYYEAISEKHIDEMSRAEEGCLRYEYSYGMAEDELLLTEVWQDAEAIEFHKNSEHFAKLGELKAEYVENTEFMKFSAEQV